MHREGTETLNQGKNDESTSQNLGCTLKRPDKVCASHING